MILGINGSPRKTGTTVDLLNRALKVANKEGAGVKLIHLVDFKLSSPSGDYSLPPENFEGLLELLIKADGVILSTPTHWFNLSTLMKNFLDNLAYYEYPDFPLEGKVAGFIASCEEDGATQAILQMLAPLNHLGFIVPPYGMVIFNKSINKKSEGSWMDKDLELLGKNVVQLVEKTKSSDWGY